ncbi:AraC family transcriptional regulator [Nitratireductor pacificus pht-3B]|uniref:AraC family transcriptional regulator n=1 Tax=Nitratireductor pacificus pht-3B TaxID=391937 RepID=K2LII0_9HYPH|nr:AraC family transcriptional regulator [Nitratireductor pacificus pht-3B]
MANRIGVPTFFAAGDQIEASSIQSAGQVCKMTGFHVGADLIAQLAEEAKLPGYDRIVEAFRTGFIWQELDDRPMLRAHLMQMADNPYNGILGRLYAESHALAALVEIASISRQERSPFPSLTRTHRERVEHATALLNEGLANPPSVPEIARIVGMNETGLRRSFKALYGMTIMEYLRERRLEVARALLRERNMSVSEIAYRIGFNNPANFATAYRRRFGCSPSQDFNDSK